MVCNLRKSDISKDAVVIITERFILFGNFHVYVTRIGEFCNILTYP